MTQTPILPKPGAEAEPVMPSQPNTENSTSQERAKKIMERRQALLAAGNNVVPQRSSEASLEALRALNLGLQVEHRLTQAPDNLGSQIVIDGVPIPSEVPHQDAEDYALLYKEVGKDEALNYYLESIKGYKWESDNADPNTGHWVKEDIISGQSGNEATSGQGTGDEALKSQENPANNKNPYDALYMPLAKKLLITETEPQGAYQKALDEGKFDATRDAMQSDALDIVQQEGLLDQQVIQTRGADAIRNRVAEIHQEVAAEHLRAKAESSDALKPENIPVEIKATDESVAAYIKMFHTLAAREGKYPTTEEVTRAMKTPDSDEAKDPENMTPEQFAEEIKKMQERLEANKPKMTDEEAKRLGQIAYDTNQFAKENPKGLREAMKLTEVRADARFYISVINRLTDGLDTKTGVTLLAELEEQMASLVQILKQKQNQDTSGMTGAEKRFHERQIERHSAIIVSLGDLRERMFPESQTSQQNQDSQNTPDQQEPPDVDPKEVLKKEKEEAIKRMEKAESDLREHIAKLRRRPEGLELILDNLIADPKRWELVRKGLPRQVLEGTVSTLPFYFLMWLWTILFEGSGAAFSPQR